MPLIPEQPGLLRDTLSQTAQSPERFVHQRMFKHFSYKGTMIGSLVHFFKADSIV